MRVGALGGIAAAAALGLAACGGGGGGGDSAGFPPDPLGALQTCLNDKGVKSETEKTPAANNSLSQIGKVTVDIPSDIIFVDVFETPKDAAFYAKGSGDYTQYGHATVTYNNYSKNNPKVDTVVECIDETGVGSDT
jgi:hypothetical protein